MCHLERALEWLRPLILDSDTWDYCVLWKLGDDPSRFIELVDCCCNGGENENQQIGIKRVKREQNLSIPFCKDVSFMHPANTKACEALSRLPSSLSLYSGIHGEVVTSNQPRWLNVTNTSDSQTSNEDCCGTHVLIPVAGGLVQLFSAKLIPEDQNIIEFVKAQFNIGPEIETMSTVTFDGHSMNLFHDQSTNSCPSSLYQPEVLPWCQPITQISPHYNRPMPNFDRSSTNSFASDEHTSPDSNVCSLSPSVPSNICSPSHEDHGVTRDRLGNSQKRQKETCKSKNLHTERNRRRRIKDGHYALRALVPNITNMSKAAILGDAIDYIKVLKNQIEELKGELEELPKEDCSKNNATIRKISPLYGEVKVRPKLEVQVKVTQLGAGHFLLRIKCQQCPGAFTKLLEALVSVGLDMNDVKDANVTACDDMLWIMLTVETNKKEIQAKDLRESLTRVTA